MDLGLAGKSALVTGASQGIGAAVARGLAEEGVKVAICSRRHEAITGMAREIQTATGARVEGFVADLKITEDIEKLVAEVVNRFGTIHILVNCAATPVFGDFFELPHEAWLSVFETKYMGYVRCLQQVIPHMIKQRDGRIVNISGAAGKEPNRMHLPGGSMNAAINLLTKGLATDLGKYNIRVNSLAPGPVATERLNSLISTKARERQIDVEYLAKEYNAEVALGRFSTPREIADVVVFLVSDRASYLTGTCVLVDGGRTRGV